MSSSGSFNTGAKEGRYLTFSWTLDSQSTADNTSIISWTLKGAGESGYYVMGRKFTVKIDGEQVFYSADNVQVRVGTLIASGTKTITHNPDGTRNFAASVSAAIYTYAVSVSGSGNWDLTALPRGAVIEGASDFGSTTGATIIYSNPAGNAVTSLQAAISFDGTTDDIAYRDVSKTGVWYEFSFTDEERVILENSSPNAKTRTVYYLLKTVLNGVTYTDSIAQNLTINDAEPVMNVTWQDTNPTTAALTNNTSHMIRYHSIFNYSINDTARKGSTIKSRSISYGNNYSTEKTGSFTNVTADKFTAITTDSRGYSTAQTYNVTLVLYSHLTASAEASISGVGDMTFTASGKWFSGWFGTTYNQLTARFRYKSSGGSFTEWAAATVSSSSSSEKYTVTGAASGLDYKESYEVEIEVSDLLETVTATASCKSFPVFDWGKEDFNFNVPIHMNSTEVMRLNDQGRLITSADSGNMYFRPNGGENEDGQAVLDTTGNLNIKGGYYVNGTQIDYVIERYTEAMGSNGTWYCEKWASGKAVCYGTRNYGTVNYNTAWGAWYESSQTYKQALPSGLFVAAPDWLDITAVNGTASAFVERGFEMDMSKDSTGTFGLARPTALTAPSTHLAFHAIGRWK